MEIRRRFSNLTVQGNYTFGKVLSDTTFGASQSNNQNYQSLQNTGLDKFINGINGNALHRCELQLHASGRQGPALPGREMNRFGNSILGGWQLLGSSPTGRPARRLPCRPTGPPPAGAVRIRLA